MARGIRDDGMTSKRAITLPNGRRVGLGVYVDAWKRLVVLEQTQPGAMVHGFSDWPDSAERVLREIRAGLHDRINRHIPGRQGRKWDDHYQRQLFQDSQKINTARRFRIYRSNINLPELRDRFNHLFASYGD